MMKCKHCGQEIPYDSNYCEYCGKKTSDNSVDNRVLLFFIITIAVISGAIIFAAALG